VSSGQHALMQNTGNQNAAGLTTIKHDVPAALHAAQARTNIVTRSAQCRIADGLAREAKERHG